MSVDRRHFLGSAAATAAFFAARDVAMVATAQTPAPPDVARPRILSLELQTAHLAAMKTFYGKTIDLRILEDKADRFTLEAGETRLTFVGAPDAPGQRTPFYHFAFNIPENKIAQAVEWQKARTPLLAVPPDRRTAGLPPEVAAHTSWNAHSIHFLDPAGNVVEYIARHGLQNGDTAPFSWADLLYVSEVGLVVDDVAAAAATVAGAAALARYAGGRDEVAALGDEYGLLLLMKRGAAVELTSEGAAVFRTAVTLRAQTSGRHRLDGYPYDIHLEERCSCL